MKQSGLKLQEEAMRCLLCTDAPCSKVCRNGNPARAIRAIRFGNEKLAGRWIAQCTDKELEVAEKACIHYDRPIRIKELATLLLSSQNGENQTASSQKEEQGKDLSIDFCGIHCENPFFLASSAQRVPSA